MKVTWEVDGVTVTCDALEEGLENGMEDAVEKILDGLEKHAKDQIAVRPTIFTGELYESFDDQTTSAHSSSGISSRFINYAKHAGAMEHGVHASKYADGAPPIQALMPWVMAKLQHWDVDTDDSGGSSVKVPTGDTGENDLDESQYESVDTVDIQRVDPNNTQIRDLWEGQEVVGYDSDDGEYTSGKIVNFKESFEDSYVEVELSDGSTKHFNYNSPKPTDVDDAWLVAGEDWDSLSESEQNVVSEAMLTSVDLNGFTDSATEQLAQTGLDNFAQRLSNNVEIKRLAININKIERDTSMSAVGRWEDNTNTIKYNPNKWQFDLDTVHHELWHAYVDSKGRTYATGAREDNEEFWDTVSQHKLGGFRYDYVSRDQSEWDTEKDQYMPHPTKYHLGTEDVGLYEDRAHPAFDSWQEHIQKDTMYQLNVGTADDAYEDFYDPFFSGDSYTVLNPDDGRVRKGDAMRIEIDNGEKSSTFETRVIKGITEDVDNETEGTHYIVLEFEQQDNYKRLPVSDDGFVSSVTSYKELAPDRGDDAFDPNGDDDGLAASDVPEDPGFYYGKEDEDERFFEAINREMWREQTADEVATPANRGDWFMRGDQYSAANAHEIAAHAGALIFTDDLVNGQDPNEELIADLLDRSPELIYMLSTKTDFSPEVVDVLEKESGKSFDDLMYQIWREDIQ